MLKAVENTQMSFNYDIIPEAVAIDAREAAQRIRLRLRRSTEDIINIGIDLIAVKERIGHGNFLPWIQAEFGMSNVTATRFMNVARVFGDKSFSVKDIDPTALYELAAPKTPLEVREEIEKMIEAGEVVTKATVDKLKADADAVAKGRDLAIKDAEKAEKKAETLQSKADKVIAKEIQKAAAKIKSDYDSEIERLKSEVADLRKPKPVTTIDNTTGNVIAFGRPLTEGDAEAIDAEFDEFKDGDFNEVASEQDKAVAFFGCIRSIAKMSANPKAVYKYIKTGRSPELVAEYMAMVDQAFSHLKSIKDQHNG